MSLKQIAVCLLFLGACSKPPPSPLSGAKPVEVEQVAEVLDGEFHFAGKIADRVYMVPSQEWIGTGFSQSWTAFREALGPWTAEDNDCDDFARGAAFFAQLLHHNTKGRPPASALAFGEFWYQRRDGVGHAINFFLYREGSALKVGYFEPQTGQPLILTPKEIESCIAWRL